MFIWGPPCRKITLPSSIRWASLSGGMRLSTGCRTRSSNVASSTSGIDRASVSRSMSGQLNRTYRTTIVTSSTEKSHLAYVEARVAFIRHKWKRGVDEKQVDDSDDPGCLPNAGAVQS